MTLTPVVPLQIKQDMNRYYDSVYNFEEVEIIQDFLENAAVLSEEELWFGSQSCEPGVEDSKSPMKLNSPKRVVVCS